jgi:6-methylsalicylate decarboxylase
MQPFHCFCETPAQPSRRGFLTGLAALGASAALPGCQTGAAPMAGKPHRIDVHHHIMPPAYVDEAVKLGMGKPPPWSVQRSIEEMDKNGIATSVVALMQPGAFFNNIEADRRLARLSNEFAAKMSSDHRGRFGSFATLPLMDVEGSLREIDYAFGTLRADGIGLMTSYGTTYLGDVRFAPIWAELNRRKAVIYTHPLAAECCRNPIQGLPPSALEFATDTSRTIASLLFSGTAARYPDIRWIFSHSGGTMPMLWSRYTRQEIDMGADKARAAMPNGALHEVRKFYYDTAQGNHDGAMKALRAIVPVSQILYGTDYPYRGGAEAVEALGARDFSSSERMAVDRENAMRILPSVAKSLG